MNIRTIVINIVAFAIAQTMSVVALAQDENNTFRIIELEDKVRQLNGKVEELNFELIKAQEQYRTLQEDIEIRFQHLEGVEGGITITPSNQGNGIQLPNTNAAGAIGGLADSDPLPSTLHFDEQGNLVESEAENGSFAALEDSEEKWFGDTAEAVFAAGKTALETKNYRRSEDAFRVFLSQWPNDERTADARYFLGQSLFSQRNYFGAANVYLNNHNDYPNANIAAENLLGLGLALAGLNQREVACVTYGEVLKKYPEAAERLKERIKAEQTGTRCNPIQNQ